jgi:alpha-methylacyl-CoA racemase
VAVGALEPPFFTALLAGLGLEGEFPAQHDRSRWPEMRHRFSECFARRTRDQWESTFAGSDACVAPVLTMAEATTHPQIAGRSGHLEVGGVRQPAPAPRFSRSVPATPRPAVGPGADTDGVLGAAGFTSAEVAELRAGGVVA